MATAKLQSNRFIVVFLAFCRHGRSTRTRVATSLHTNRFHKFRNFQIQGHECITKSLRYALEALDSTFQLVCVMICVQQSRKWESASMGCEFFLVLSFLRNPYVGPRAREVLLLFYEFCPS
jgi:hypothetical protein